jgi:hypothetical protein
VVILARRAKPHATKSFKILFWEKGGPAEEDNITADDFKPSSFSLEMEADVAMDMDSVTEYFEYDDYPWEDMFGEYRSESDTSTDNDGADYESS